jgi:hypothetical protein
MQYLANNLSDFMQSISLSDYRIPENIEYIDPVQYLIAMTYNEPETYNPNRIFAIRTYGTNNSLVPQKYDLFSQTYFGMISRGNLYVTRTTTHIIELDGKIYYRITDENDDEYEFSLDDIASNVYNNPLSIPSYIRYDPDIFEPKNLLAKIPVNLLKHLV